MMQQAPYLCNNLIKAAAAPLPVLGRQASRAPGWLATAEPGLVAVVGCGCWPRLSRPPRCAIGGKRACRQGQVEGSLFSSLLRVSDLVVS
jgi:hypothetical protein